MIKTMTTKPAASPSRFAMPTYALVSASGHGCVQVMTGEAIVRERAIDGAAARATGLVVKGAFPGPDAWSPPS